jgi:hypothetical protein
MWIYSAATAAYCGCCSRRYERVIDEATGWRSDVLLFILVIGLGNVPRTGEETDEHLRDWVEQ